MLNEELIANKEKLIEDCPPSFTLLRKFIGINGEKEDWTLKNIMIGKTKTESKGEAFKKFRRSTWFYRRALPFFLLIIWTILAGTVNFGYAILIIVTAIGITLFLFDP